MILPFSTHGLDGPGLRGSVLDATRGFALSCGRVTGLIPNRSTGLYPSLMLFGLTRTTYSLSPAFNGRGAIFDPHYGRRSDGGIA